MGDTREQLLSGYNVHRSEDRSAMLKAIGLPSIEALFSYIPSAIRLKRPLKVPAPHTEWRLRSHLESLARQNRTTADLLCFLGGGAYEHHVPAVVDAICSRGEFLTAYTPYQPEMSQGLLQVLHEYQKLVSALTGLPVANCSLYDGATAVAEAAWMACSIKKVKRVLASDALWPEWKQVLQTYMDGRGVELEFISVEKDTGQVDAGALEKALRKPAATFVVQSPNSHGVIEALETISRSCKKAGSLLNVSAYPTSLGLLQAPGEQGADIVTCEGQSLGLHLSAGGPYLGVVSAKKEFQRFMPGRMVGVLTDLNGNPAYALIKEDREQHVSRERATSHICSNQALQAMRAALYMASVGENGFREIARQNVAKAHFFAGKLCATKGVKLAYSGPYFNEFELKLPCSAAKLRDRMMKAGVLIGIPAGDDRLLVAVTEMRSKEEMEATAKAFSREVKALS